MKSSIERIEHHTVPIEVAEELRLAGGDNPFGEPNFRLVWGYDRIVPVHGEWQQWGNYQATLTDKFTGHKETRQFTKLEHSVIETRLLPKYLPGNCFHLENWRPASEYGTPEQWSKLGEEVIGGLTIDTSGPYPERGEYELCYPLTTDGTSRGTPIPLVTAMVVELVRMITYGRGRMTFVQRKAAIEQRVRREEEGYVKRVADTLRDGLRPFAGNEFVTVPESKSVPTGTGESNEPS